jgi:hypothetical protein
MSSSTSWLGLEGSANLAKGPLEGKLACALNWENHSETEDSRRKTLDEDNVTQLSDGIIRHEDGIVKQARTVESSAARSLDVENATKPGAVPCRPRGHTGSVNGSLSSSSSSSSFETLEAQQNEIADVTAPLEGFIDRLSPTTKAIPVDQSQLCCRRSFFSRFVDASSSSYLVYKRHSESELEDCRDNTVNTEGNDVAYPTSCTTLMESLVVSMNRNSPPGRSSHGASTEQEAEAIKLQDTMQTSLSKASTDVEPFGYSHVAERSNRDDSSTAPSVPTDIASTPESQYSLVSSPITDEAGLFSTAASTIIALPVDPIDIVPERRLILIRQGRRNRDHYLWRVMVHCGCLCVVLFLFGGMLFAMACAISKAKCLAPWRNSTARTPTS